MVGKRDYFCEILRLISFARITAKCENVILIICYSSKLNKSSKGVRNAISTKAFLSRFQDAGIKVAISIM